MANRQPPTEINCKNFKFLITDIPNDSNNTQFIKILSEHNVTALVRLCSRTSSTNNFENSDIFVYDLMYEDGGCPSKSLVKEWFQLLKDHVKRRENSCVAVQCSAGFGRAPVMVALALIELGLEFEDVVELIRSKRKGSFNMCQLRFLEKYKRKSRLKLSNNEQKCKII